KIVSDRITQIEQAEVAGQQSRGLATQDADLVLDADGRWAIPGLWDAHVHLRQWAQIQSRIDVGAANSAADVTRLIDDHVRSLDARHLHDSPRNPKSVVFGYGFRSAIWPSQPTVAELDAVSGQHPVILTSGDAHNGWLNTAALRLLGVPERTGPLTENEWFAVAPTVTRLAGEILDDTTAIRAAVRDAAARGVVGITDFEFADGVRDWPGRFGIGIDQLRVRAAVYPAGLEAVIAAGLRTGDPLPGCGGLATMGPLKIISDGSLNTRTAHCHEPYVDAPATGTDESSHPKGVQNYDLDELIELLSRATSNQLKIALHAIGDAAVSIALDAFEATGAQGSLEHAQLVRSQDLARMAALRLRASVQPAHLLDDRDVTRVCWPDRADRCFPLRSMLDAGVELALGSDAPVAALDPWLAMAAAVHRSNDDREPWNAAEALTPAEALAASTDGQSTLHLGGPGDLVLLDQDPLAPTSTTADAARQLREIGVAATLVAGRPTHLTF
ncbi:MAG: amidohydrolase family protein, partial [Microlunatus sp.]